MHGRSCLLDKPALKYGVILLMVVSGAGGFPLKLGPAVRYMILKESELYGVEDVSYEESTSRLLFCDKALLLPGVVVEVNLTHGMSADLRYFRCGYNPCYVIVSDTTALYPPDRSGSLSLFELGLKRDFEGLHLRPGLELQRYREEWTDPFDGGQNSLDSTTVGPFFAVGTSMNLSPVELRMEMGLVFPGLDDVQGKITFMLLAP